VQLARALIDAYPRTIARLRILSRSTRQDVWGVRVHPGKPAREKSGIMAQTPQARLEVRAYLPGEVDNVT
jgi:hypothetical protein